MLVQSHCGNDLRILSFDGLVAVKFRFSAIQPKVPLAQCQRAFWAGNLVCLVDAN